MLYVDQPIGVGFSYGTDPVTSTVTAAPYVWKLLQAFYAQFPQYENRDFGIFTESYGGHYGPGKFAIQLERLVLMFQEFASYFEAQNAAIAEGTVTGQNVSLVALGINNGWYDPIIQEKAYVDFSYNNTYKALISSSQHTSYLNTYNSECLPGLKQCSTTTGSNSACEDADNACYQYIEGPLSEVADFDVYDIREPSNDPYPPETYVSYLQSSAVMSAIGAQSTYAECPDSPYEKFANTGDGTFIISFAIHSSLTDGLQMLAPSSPLFLVSFSRVSRLSSGQATPIGFAIGSEVSRLQTQLPILAARLLIPKLCLVTQSAALRQARSRV